MKELTIKQKRFADEYLIDLNATQAAIRAGYSEQTAQQQSSRLLLNVVVKAYVDTKQKQLAEKTNINMEWVIDSLRKNYERAMQEVPVLDYEGNTIGEYRYEGSVANRSLELIGKHLGGFRERLELTGKDGKPLQVESNVRIYIPENNR